MKKTSSLLNILHRNLEEIISDLGVEDAFTIEEAEDGLRVVQYTWVYPALFYPVHEVLTHIGARCYRRRDGLFTFIFRGDLDPNSEVTLERWGVRTGAFISKNELKRKKD